MSRSKRNAPTKPKVKKESNGTNKAKTRWLQLPASSPRSDWECRRSLRVLKIKPELEINHDIETLTSSSAKRRKLAIYPHPYVSLARLPSSRTNSRKSISESPKSIPPKKASKLTSPRRRPPPKKQEAKKKTQSLKRKRQGDECKFDENEQDSESSPSPPHLEREDRIVPYGKKNLAREDQIVLNGKKYDVFEFSEEDIMTQIDKKKEKAGASKEKSRSFNNKKKMKVEKKNKEELVPVVKKAKMKNTAQLAVRGRPKKEKAIEPPCGILIAREEADSSVVYNTMPLPDTVVLNDYVIPRELEESLGTPQYEGSQLQQFMYMSQEKYRGTPLHKMKVLFNVMARDQLIKEVMYRRNENMMCTNNYRQVTSLFDRYSRSSNALMQTVETLVQEINAKDKTLASCSKNMMVSLTYKDGMATSTAANMRMKTQENAMSRRVAREEEARRVQEENKNKASTSSGLGMSLVPANSLAPYEAQEVREEERLYLPSHFLSAPPPPESFDKSAQKEHGQLPLLSIKQERVEEERVEKEIINEVEEEEEEEEDEELIDVPTLGLVTHPTPALFQEEGTGVEEEEQIGNVEEEERNVEEEEQIGNVEEEEEEEGMQGGTEVGFTTDDYEVESTVQVQSHVESGVEVEIDAQGEEINMESNGEFNMGNNGEIHMGNNGEINMGNNEEINMGNNGEIIMENNGEIHMGNNGEIHMVNNGEINMGNNGEMHMGNNGEIHMGSNGEIDMEIDEGDIKSLEEINMRKNGEIVMEIVEGEREKQPLLKEERGVEAESTTGGEREGLQLVESLETHSDLIKLAPPSVIIKEEVDEVESKADCVEESSHDVDEGELPYGNESQIEDNNEAQSHELLDDVGGDGGELNAEEMEELENISHLNPEFIMYNEEHSYVETGDGVSETAASASMTVHGQMNSGQIFLLQSNAQASSSAHAYSNNDSNLYYVDEGGVDMEFSDGKKQGEVEGDTEIIELSSDEEGPNKNSNNASLSATLNASSSSSTVINVKVMTNAEDRLANLKKEISIEEYVPKSKSKGDKGSKKGMRSKGSLKEIKVEPGTLKNAPHNLDLSESDSDAGTNVCPTTLKAAVSKSRVKAFSGSSGGYGPVGVGGSSRSNTPIAHNPPLLPRPATDDEREKTKRYTRKRNSGSVPPSHPTDLLYSPQPQVPHHWGVGLGGAGAQGLYGSNQFQGQLYPQSSLYSTYEQPQQGGYGAQTYTPHSPAILGRRMDVGQSQGFLPYQGGQQLMPGSGQLHLKGSQPLQSHTEFLNNQHNFHSAFSPSGGGPSFMFGNIPLRPYAIAEQQIQFTYTPPPQQQQQFQPSQQQQHFTQQQQQQQQHLTQQQQLQLTQQKQLQLTQQQQQQNHREFIQPTTPARILGRMGHQKVFEYESESEAEMERKPKFASESDLSP